MKIVVCGDSYMTQDTRCPGGHFSEMLAPHEVVNLARGGISNTGICFQLEQAAKLAPHVVIVGTTDSSRMEVPTGNGKFNPRLGLKNIAYSHKISGSYGTEYAGTESAPIASDTLSTLSGVAGSNYALTDNIKHAVKEYLAYLHVPELKSVTDSWMINYWIMILQQAGVQVMQAREIMPEIYSYAGPTEGTDSVPWVFHTDRATQIAVRQGLKENFGI